MGSDIYAFGCIILEFFSEKQVWHKLAPTTIMFKVAVEGNYPSTDGLDPPLLSIVQDLCFVEFEKRASALEILKQLSLLL